MTSVAPPTALPRLEAIERERFPLTPEQQSELAISLGITELSEEIQAYVEEVLSSYKTGLSILQKTGNQTVPSNIKLLLKRLRKSLKPFLEECSAVDQDTFDLLKPQINDLDQLAERRICQLTEEPRVNVRTEHVTNACAHLKLAWDSAASKDKKASKQSRRNFVFLALKIAGARVPDPMKQGKKLDEMIDSPLNRSNS